MSTILKKNSVLLQEVLCQQSVTSTLHMADAFGNAVLTGGASVTAHLHTKEDAVLCEVSLVCIQSTLLEIDTLTLHLAVHQLTIEL